MTTEGAVFIDRQIRHHWLWKDKPFTRGQAWVDLILTANWQDNKVAFGNEIIEIKRGQQIRTQRELADRWGWGRQAVRGFLSVLEAGSMITQKINPKATQITILNYDDFQNLQPLSNPRATRVQPTRNPRATLNNKDNKDNKENNKDSARERTEIAKRVIDKINEVSGRGYRHTESNLENIRARLAEGHSEDDCMKVVTIKWADPDFNKKYFRPVTLFRPSNFEGYLFQEVNGGNQQGDNTGCTNSFLRAIRETTD